MTIINEIKYLFTSGNLLYMMQGVLVTLQCSVGILLVSFILGTMLALFKQYGNKVLKKIAIIYTEIFRNTPTLMWICLCFIALPFDSQIIRASFGIILVSTAIVSEIVRGGLNSIQKGQFEAGASQGMTLIQILVFIVLPQCLRKIVPNLINQAISVLKDTSLLGQVAIAEFLYRTKKLVSIANIYTGHGINAMDAFLLFGFAAIIYFSINSILSYTVRKIQAATLKI